MGAFFSVNRVNYISIYNQPAAKGQPLIIWFKVQGSKFKVVGPKTTITLKIKVLDGAHKTLLSLVGRRQARKAYSKGLSSCTFKQVISLQPKALRGKSP
jgi:hypothetical protein